MLSKDRSIATQSLRDSVLDFMASNPTAWRTKALATKLGVDAERMAVELARLTAEGKLVSCTVKAPGGQPQQEYRIAAIELKVNPHNFVISKRTKAR